LWQFFHYLNKEKFEKYLDDLHTYCQVRIIQVDSVAFPCTHHNASQQCNNVISMNTAVVSGFVDNAKLKANKSSAEGTFHFK